MAEFTVTAHVLQQHGYELYLFPMNSRVLKQICYVTPRSKDDPSEVQRILDEKRAQDIGAYVRQQTAVLPNAIVISLTAQVEIREGGEFGKKVIVFPSQQGKFAYILDGQHRLAGFRFSEGLEFDLPVVALYNANEQLRGKIFADINSKQVKVTDVHLLSLYYQIRELPLEEAATMEVVLMLANDADSPLRGKVKVRDDDRGTWVTNRYLKQVVAPHVQSGGCLSLLTTAQQAQVLKQYFHAAKQTWDEAWGKNRDYMLTKPMGLEVLAGIFDVALHRCDLNEGRTYSAVAFQRQLQPLLSASIQVPGGGVIQLTWGKGSLAALSNSPGRSLIRKQLRDTLQQADR